MSIMEYISFPMAQARNSIWYIKNDGERRFRINKEVDDSWRSINIPVIKGQTDCCFSIWDIRYKVTFDMCFSNPHVYKYGIFVPNRFEEKMAIFRRYNSNDCDPTADCSIDSDAMHKELDIHANNDWSLRNQVLYEYFYENLDIGEFVEIYTSWIEEEDENGMYFKPPTSETVINLQELPHLPYSRECLEFGERKKLTIHKTE